MEKGNGHYELVDGRHQCGGLRYKSKVPRARGSHQPSPDYAESSIPPPLKREDHLPSPRDHPPSRISRNHSVATREIKDFVTYRDHPLPPPATYQQRKRGDHQPTPSKIQRAQQRDHYQGMVDHQSSTIGTTRCPPDGQLDLGDTDEQKAWRQLVGERVCISGVKQGTLRYFGRTNFAQGHWCGIELDEPVGKNDGTVAGVVYFACRPNHGIFAPVGKVSRLNDAWRPDASEDTLNDLGSSSSSWRSKEPGCDPRHWEFTLEESSEKKFIRNSISDPTFMQGNVKVAAPRGSESFSFDKRDFVESSKNYAKSTVKHSSSSRSLSKYGYAKKNQYLSSNVITLGDNVGEIQSTHYNNGNGNLPASMEQYNQFLKTPTNSGQVSPTSSELPAAKRLNEMPMCDYGGKVPNAFFNSFQLHDFSDFEDEVDNDDQMSVDYDESLGILTPGQMKELTFGSDFPTSLSDIRGLEFPSSESFDDINDLPEDEQVHDVSVIRMSELSQTRVLQVSKQNGSNNYNKNLKGAVGEKVRKNSTDKFLSNMSQKSIENNFLVDHRFTSTAAEFPSKSIDNLARTYNVNDLSTANIMCTEKVLNSDEQISEKYYKVYSKEESSNVVRLQSSSELHSNLSIAQLPEADLNMMEIDQKNVSCSNQSDNIKPIEKVETETKCRQTGDTLHSVELESNPILKEKLTVSWEDCLSRDGEVFPHVERPESVYTVGSSDTGFHEDGESEVGMTTSIDSTTDETKRFSSTSRDSCIIVSDEVDVYKIAESNSTSGYSTGLSDSCCNDRDDLSSKRLTDEEVQDSVEHCDSEDAFSFQENSLGKDGDMFNMETSDITTENITAVDNKESTSDALCETMVEDSTLTEINELLMSPDDKTQKSSPSESKEMEIVPEGQLQNVKDVLKTQDSVESSKASTNSPVQSTPERRPITTRARGVTSTRNSSALNKTSRTPRDEEAEKKRQQVVVPKSPKKNVMSKIKAMIEATSCKNVGRNGKEEVEPTAVTTRRTASAPKKSRWDAVTSKIAASLAEEKTKPKARREIKSRVNTNLTSVRQQPVPCKAPNLDSCRSSNCGDGTMSPVSVCSRDKRALTKNNSAPTSLREGRPNVAQDVKQRPKSPRPGGRLTASRCGSPAASESSTSASLRSFSHNSKSKVGPQWKGSNSTIASSVPPSNKRPPPLSATKSTSSSTRVTPNTARTINKKPPATVPKIRITASDRSQSPVPAKKLDRTKRQHSRSTKEHAASKTSSHLLPSKPGRPPLWLSKAELSQEIQRLGTLCEARTKELNRLKMETRHVTLGFDAFASLFKYMVEDVNGLSVPKLSEDLEKTLKQLELAKQDLAYYEREVEEMKAHHCQELNDLSNKLFEVFQGEVTELGTKHLEEINRLKQEHELQLQATSETYKAGYVETQASHEAAIKKLQQELLIQREELQLIHEKELKDLEEKHCESSKTLHEHIEQLQKKCAELKQHSMGMEDAMKKDTDSKLQWVTSRKGDLEKEVESLKAVLEMKNKELHTLRVQTLEMEKQLEDLPLAREKIKMLSARAEDLEALMVEKTMRERTLSTENQEIRNTYEKESKINRRLSMENEELQWRLRQAEQSLITASFSEVVEEEPETSSGPVSPAKSPLQMSRSVFFTFVDRDAASPRSPYKKITPGFYKPGSKSSAPSPRRGRGQSEPLQPSSASTPKRTVSAAARQKRQRAGTGESQSFASSMVSSVGSECSVFDQKEQAELLEEHKEEIMESLEILREQRCSEENDGEKMASPCDEDGGKYSLQKEGLAGEVNCCKGDKMECSEKQLVASDQNVCHVPEAGSNVENVSLNDEREHSGHQQNGKTLVTGDFTDDIPSQKEGKIDSTGGSTAFGQNGNHHNSSKVTGSHENDCKAGLKSSKSSDLTTTLQPNSLELLPNPEQPGATIDKNCSIESPNKNGSDPETPSSTSTFDGDEMTRSTDFSDMKTYYHMTFPVLKEAEEGNKVNIDTAQVTHSTVESSQVVSRVTRSEEVVSTKTVVVSTQENGASTVVEEVSQHSALSKSTCSYEEKGLDSECMDKSREKNRWRTM